MPVTNKSNGVEIFALPSSPVGDRVQSEIVNVKVVWECATEAGPSSFDT